MIQLDSVCDLCGLDLPSNAVMDEGAKFCCPGCHAVFRILSAKEAVSQFRDSAIFQQAAQSGLISNPQLLEQIRLKQIPGEDKEKLVLEIEGMWCPACAELIQLVLLQKKGVYRCVVDYATDLASIEFSPRIHSKADIQELIHSYGYDPKPLSSDTRKVSFSLYLRLYVALFFSINAMMFSYPLYATYFDLDTGGYGNLFAWLSGLASLPVVTYSAFPIYRRFWKGMTAGLLGMETLVVIAVGSAFGLSLYDLLRGGNHVYFDSMSVIITFLLLGKVIEAKAKFSAKNSLLQLSLKLPKRGRKRLPNGDAKFVLLKEVELGDLLIACTGEKIVLDGVVEEGSGALDESAMTGEAIPAAKKVGDSLLSGTVVKQGWIAYRVTSTPEESALHRIVEMVGKEMGHKTAYLRAADQVVRWFVPVVLLIAAVSGFGGWLIGSSGEESLLRAISVLLISCPCALGIAAPLAESHTLNAMAKMGAIVRNRGCLRILGDEDVFVFDKTGTITEGVFEVRKGLESFTREQLGCVKGLAVCSTHPISRAIAQAISESPVSYSEILEYPGKGIMGKRDGKAYFLGSGAWMREMGLEVATQSECSSSFFVSEGEIKEIQLGDRLREGVPELIQAIAPAKTMLLSGDNARAVAAAAAACGIPEWRAECYPLEKKEVLDSFRRSGKKVAMMGDGINDAPALTSADVSISVVSATDISIQVSDILLTTERLGVILALRRLAKKGRRIVKQNLFWAFFYNGIGVFLAAFGVLSPLFAAFAMISSSLIVLANSRRLSEPSKK